MSRIKLLPFITAFVAIFVPVNAEASVQSGLKMTVYDNYTNQNNFFNGSPPVPPETPVCLETIVEKISNDFDSNPVCGLWDDFQVKYEGYITTPTTDTYEFCIYGDDGTIVYLDNELVEYFWYDTGNGGGCFIVEAEQGKSLPITAWYYENGGGSWVDFRYLVEGEWATVPASFFTQESVPTTTTTELTTTTSTLVPYFNAPQNLTATANTDGSVVLEWEAPNSSNVEPYVYTIVFFDMDSGEEVGGWAVWKYANLPTTYTLGNQLFNGSNPVTTGYGPVRFKVRAGTSGCVGEGGSCLYGPEVFVDTNVLDPELSTTTTTAPTTTTTISTTSTTQVPKTTTTTEFVPPPSNTTSSLLEVSTSTTTIQQNEIINVVSTSQEVSSDTEPVVPTTQKENDVRSGNSTEPSVQETLPEPEQFPEDETPTQETAPELPLSTEDAINKIDLQSMSGNEISTSLTQILEEPLTKEEFKKVVGILESDSVSQDQVNSIVKNIIENGISQEQATELATSAKVLESISSDVATEIFQEIKVNELTSEQSAQIVAAVQNAPTEVKEAFEEEINVYGGAFDIYVPVDSKVNVKTRRVLVAAGAALFAAPALSMPSSPSTGGTPGSPSGGGNPSNGGSGGGTDSGAQDKQSSRSKSRRIGR